MAVVLFYVLVKNNSMREVGLIVLFLAVSILLADQFSSSFCKPYFARFRPAQDPLLMYLVDVVDAIGADATALYPVMPPTLSPYVSFWLCWFVMFG